MTKNQLIGVIGITAAVGLFLLGRGCGIKSVEKTAGTVVTVTKDSLVYVDRPKPYKVDSLVYVKGKDGEIKTIIKTLPGVPEIIIEPADTAAILKKFYEVAYYQDIRDTGRARITILDTVTQNRIRGRSVKVLFSDTTTKTTMILKPPRNLVGYFTVSAMGNFQYPGAGIGAGFALKLPNDRFYQAEIKLVNGHKPMAEIRIGMPLRSKHN